MGWTSYVATHWKNGNIDRKAECDALWVQEEHGDYGQVRILKSSMVGSTYYAALEVTYPVSNKKLRQVFGMVCLTSVEKNEFAYKDMSEDMGPYAYDCPQSILKLLTPTESEFANEWREKCVEYQTKKKELKDCPVGTMIKFKWNGQEQVYIKHAPAYQFRTPFWLRDNGCNYISASKIPMDFEFVGV